ncbi:MAG: PEP-CTERM sorting domain-containing protein, partial [Opitutales bacterium]|nr:PEP-CTERM sorting domain-containing protein [Opitutales bacterium]
VVNGSGRNSSKQDADDFILGIYASSDGSDFVFEKNATLTQVYQSNGATNWTHIDTNSGVPIGAKIITNSAKGSINLGNKLTIARGTVFVMNTTDAFILGSGEAWGATSQATSIFNLIDYNVSAATAGIHTRFEINAANNIGAISFDAARVIEMAFGENGSLVLGEEAGEYFNSLRGDNLVDNCILLEGLVIEKLRVYDVSEENLKKYFDVIDDSLYALDVKAVNGEANAFWVNTVAVPEPAEWAMIFGAIALGFVAYRRRK